VQTRLYEGSFKGLIRLCSGPVKALSRRYQGSIKALLRDAYQYDRAMRLATTGDMWEKKIVGAYQYVRARRL
jgi:hypothetical protein